jgi:hypothetical protein
MKEEVQKKKFEVKIRPAKNGLIEQAIYIDGELLDWQIDLDSFFDAIKMGPKFAAIVQKDIEQHFAESVSDFIGRKVTVEDVRKATKEGWI